VTFLLNQCFLGFLDSVHQNNYCRNHHIPVFIVVEKKITYPVFILRKFKISLENLFKKLFHQKKIVPDLLLQILK